MEEKCICPCCGADVTEFMHEQVIRHLRRKQVVEAKKKITREQRAEMTRASQERLRKWRLEHPEEAREKALAASRARTSDSFERQAQTVRDTARKKTLKFAELLYAAKESGALITPELESELMEKARELVKADNKAERTARKKAEKESVTAQQPKDE